MEVNTLYGKAPNDEIYTTQIADDGTVTVQFGDGKTGARLPTGTENVKATFRVGTGLEGLLTAGQLSMLMTPHLGLSKVINPFAPTGAADPEKIDKARSNAPLNTLTIKRIVSISDYEDFAKAFSGIEKAKADLIWNGEKHLVHITVAAPQSNSLDENIKANLIKAIDNVRHINYAVSVNNFKSVKFHVKAKIFIDSRYIKEKVVKQAEEKLKSTYCFDKSNFASSITPSHVISELQSVDGVVATDLDVLSVNIRLMDRENQIFPAHYRITSNTAFWDELNNKMVPAEILTIDTDTIKIIPVSV